ncbi:MAG: aromatic amino acid lyase [Bacteroidetes bacterium]|nr:aromatic amino acid lyase [Bacteroidota bacterium]
MIKIGDKDITINEINEILSGNAPIEISKGALLRVNQSFKFLKEFSKGKVIYGINTGFGPMVQYKVSEKDQQELQYNLIRSHSAGAGKPLSNLQVKATMLARLNTLAKGYSGIHEEVIILLKELINRNVYPLIFEHGGVGASGDLVQLAHLALVLIGEGEVNYKGKWVSTASAFKAEKLKPISIHTREGLALINGTSAMTGIGLINAIDAQNLLRWSIMASSMISEIVETFDDHFSHELNHVKLHNGQNSIAAAMRAILTDSKLIKKRPEHLYHKKIEVEVMREKVQEYYSLRCVPQILGPVLDTIQRTKQILASEINSVNDNPIIDRENNNVFHGGNFHGDYVSLEMDKLKIVVTKLSMLCERQLNFLLNDKLNQKLPPFVNLGKLGLNLGMQGAQFTATSTVAENQTLSFPMYVHSIPNNNDNQDIVSMGTNSALLTQKVIENAFQVIAIEYITILQAIDYLKFETKLSSKSRKLYKTLRTIVPKFTKDAIKYKEIEAVKNYLQSNSLQILN